MTSLHCSECLAENAAGSRACVECGHPFRGEPTTLLGNAHTAPATAAAAVAPSPQAVEQEGAEEDTNLLQAETMLQNRYRITQLLGQGGMGAVYLAVDTRFSSRTCVIKEMLDHFNDPEQRAQATESFHREADFLASLRHPGIPEVYDRFTESNRHYLVMEYINGVDLEQRLIDNGGPFSEKDVINWMIQTLDVLSYLHHQNPPIIYRDMKPANIITTSWGKVSLIDFGIARFFNPVSRGTMIGTQGYAPPEQYRGQVEPRSDLYASGATMHYLLTGRDPQNEAPFSFPPVRTLNPEISEEMEMVILKTLDPELENRFASADEMLSQLMLMAGENSDVVRECPHCGQKSSITRQFCPHCKQYISKKAHVLKPKDGSGTLVKDAAGQHVNKAAFNTVKFDEGNRAATATNLSVPTSPVSLNLTMVPVKPLIYGAAGVAALLVLAVVGSQLLGGAPTAMSAGEAIIGEADPDKTAGVRAYKSGDFQQAIVSFGQAVQKHPGDGEARIYLANSYLRLNKVPTFTLALAGSFTGPLKAKGQAQLQGAAFAQEQINGSDQSPRVLITLADDRSDAEGAVKVARQVADHQDVAGVVGHLDSGATWNALPMYNLAGLPVISPTSTSSQLSGLSPNFFRLSPDDDLQGAALARYVTGAMKAKLVTVLEPEGNPHQHGLANSFANQAERAGAEVETITFNAESDWGQIASTIKTQQPQAVFLAGNHLDAVALTKAQRAAGGEVPVVGGDSLYLPDLLEAGGGDVEGLICGTYYHSALNTPQATRFEVDFKNKLGNEANSRAALTYEAVQLFAQAARVGGSSREAIAHYIKSHGRQGFDGLSGHASLDAKGNVRRPLFLMQIKNGQFVPLTQVVL